MLLAGPRCSESTLFNAAAILAPESFSCDPYSQSELIKFALASF